MDEPRRWSVLFWAGSLAAGVSGYLGAAGDQQGWMLVTWFAMFAAIIGLVGWSDHRRPGREGHE